ncbi:MAG: TIGR04282 family arsenosugar biosynthesis glycosyltransferase [Ferruginibacter sp.]
MKEALIIFAKNPEMGKVKTRLAATIGNEAALAVYHQLLLHTVSATEYLPVDKFVFYSDFIQEEDVWTTEYYLKELQQGIDLGERMKNAFASIFQKGYEKIAIIGTDCPGVNAGIIMNAFAYLQYNDVAIGPAEDGGYYLLAMNKLHPEIFEGIRWSSGEVLKATISKCDALQLKHYLFPVLNDIDEEKDLQTFKLQRQ